jgi:hypothetical protein
MYGVQLVRYGSPRLDKMSLRDMDRFRLIVVPDSAYILRSTYEKLKKTRSKVLLTGCFGQALDGEQVPLGGSREIDGSRVSFIERPAGQVSVCAEHPVTKGLTDILKRLPVTLDKDESFRFDSAPPDSHALLNCGDQPLLTMSGPWPLPPDPRPPASAPQAPTPNSQPLLFLHGHLFASACWNPKRVPPDLGGSKDPSANEVDMWGPYDSAHPQNEFTTALMKNILDWAEVDYRVPNPKPRTVCPYLGDQMEQASISANMVYNNTAQPQTITVRVPFGPKGLTSRKVGERYETAVSVPGFGYVVLSRESPEGR